jgi:PAS domain S-box-containing protein
MKPFGIEKQTLLAALLPILVMAVLLENYLIHSRFADLESALLERSQLLVRQLASSSEYAVFASNTALLKQNVDAALAQPDVSRVVVLDAFARPLTGGPGGERGQYENLLAKANMSTPVYQDEDVLILYDPIAATEIKMDDLDRESGLMPATTSAAPLGAVIVEISKHRLIQKKHEILLYSLSITLLILMAALMLALWVARGITRPIKGMSQAIRSFGEGNMDTRILLHPKVLELNELATGFNQMAHKLQHHQEILEARVAERTSALAASEHESRTLIENTPDTIARYDRDCRRTYANPAFAAMAVGGGAALLGKKPSEFPGGPGSDLYEAKISGVFATGEDAHFELKWAGRDGKLICSSIRLTAERDLSGSVISVLAVGRDITELNESKDELTRKELAKSRFLAAAGHDLRQPLAAANLFIDALKFTKPSPEQNQVIQRLDQTMATFNELLEALLNISKLDAGIVKPQYSSFNVIHIINWLEQNFEPMARKKQLGFKLHFSMKEALAIRSDIDLIKSVLMNLVSNAIKYTTRGAILVSARRRGNDVLFQVWDSGIGIKHEHIDHIFDEFYQINNPERDRTSGLGLGLAISKRAISLLGGKITCRSRIGRGSVFEFRLPLDCSQSMVTPQSGTAPAPEYVSQISFARGKRFIVLEDDALVAEAICKALELMGGEVEYFDNAEDALFHANVEHAHYYIADYKMGGTMNGIQFLNRVRQKLDKPILAVVMTGDTSPSFIREAENCDWPVLHKPVNISKLISRLSEQYGMND